MQPRYNCNAAQRIHTFEGSVRHRGIAWHLQEGPQIEFVPGKVPDVPQISRAPRGITWHSLSLHIRDIQLC